MKHTVTPFEGKNGLVAFTDLIFGSCFLETNIGCYLAKPSLVLPDTQLEVLPSPIGTSDLCTVDSSSTSVGHSSCIYYVLTLYFESPKTQEGFGAGCVLIDP